MWNLNNRGKNNTPFYFKKEDKVLKSNIDIENGLKDYYREKLLSRNTESDLYWDFDSSSRKLLCRYIFI